MLGLDVGKLLTGAGVMLGLDVGKLLTGAGVMLGLDAKKFPMLCIAFSISGAKVDSAFTGTSCSTILRPEPPAPELDGRMLISKAPESCDDMVAESVGFMGEPVPVDVVPPVVGAVGLAETGTATIATVITTPFFVYTFFGTAPGKLTVNCIL